MMNEYNHTDNQIEQGGGNCNGQQLRVSEGRKKLRKVRHHMASDAATRTSPKTLLLDLEDLHCKAGAHSSV